jgi:hypothetical protein
VKNVMAIIILVLCSNLVNACDFYISFDKQEKEYKASISGHPSNCGFVSKEYILNNIDSLCELFNDGLYDQPEIDRDDVIRACQKNSKNLQEFNEKS